MEGTNPDIEPTAVNRPASVGNYESMTGGSPSQPESTGTLPASQSPTGGSQQRFGGGNFRSTARSEFEAAKQQGIQKATAARVQAEQDLQNAKQYAQTEGAKTLEQNQAAMQSTAQAAKDARQGAQEMRQLPPSAILSAAQQGAARAEQQYAQNKAALEKNKEVYQSVRGEAEARMQAAKMQGVAVGQQALARGEQYASTAVDIARNQTEAKWAELVEQERKLNVLEEQVVKQEKRLDQLRRQSEPNWPRPCCCIQPMVHHDILGDIDRDRQGFVRKAYSNYYFTCFLLVANFGMALAMQFISNKKKENGEEPEEHEDVLQHVIVAGVMLIGIVFAFIIWYWPIYRALGMHSSGQHVMAQAGLGFAFLFDVFACLGPVGYGACGIFYSMEINKTKGSNPFIAAIILAVLWGCQAVFFGWQWYRMRKYYKEDKASLKDAQAEIVGDQIKSTMGL